MKETYILRWDALTILRSAYKMLNKWVIILLLFIPVASALTTQSESYHIDFVIKPAAEMESENYKYTTIINPISGNQTGIYQGFLLSPLRLPSEAAEGAGGGGGSLLEQQELEDLKKRGECSKDIPFIQRLFSTCKVPNNGICDDGEYILIDKDCSLTFSKVRNYELFTEMWLLRILLVIALFLFFKNDPNFKIVVAVLIALFVYNHAFGLPSEGISCDGSSFLFNFGYCMMPSSPLLGWAVGAALVTLIIWLFMGRGDKKEKRKPYKQVGDT